MQLTTELIMEKGKFLGNGCSREAYKYKGNVYKIVRDLCIGYSEFDEYGTQAAIEQDLYEMVPEEYKNLFPNPVWLDDGIMQVEEVEIAEKIIKPWDSDTREKVTLLSETVPPILQQTDMLAMLVQQNLMDELDKVVDFILWAESEGIEMDDLFDNSGNFGLRDGEVKFVDWGLASY